MNQALAQPAAAAATATATRPYFSCRDLHAYYGESYIVQGVSFDVKESEIVALHKLNTQDLPVTLAFTPMAEFPPADYCFALRRDVPDRELLLAKVGKAVAGLHASGDLQKMRHQFYR